MTARQVPFPTAVASPGRRPPLFPADFNASPFLVIWEVTRACALACVHCRADAIPRRNPHELSTEEGLRLIDAVRGFGDPPPLFVLTGGDPMRRPDLATFVAHASERGLQVALTPSGTAAATRQRLAELQSAGLRRLAVSLDGPDAATHDAFRRVRGSFDWTMRIIRDATALGIPLQINTTVGRLTYDRLEAMSEVVRGLPIVLWAVFFLIATGRGAGLDQITADECETALEFLYALSREAPFGIKTTEAPHYHRLRLQRERAAGQDVRQFEAAAARVRSSRAVTDGNGFVFIDHVGQICPSGFLPIACGNVRRDSLVGVYRDHELFRRLRRPETFEGKCGRCEFRDVCGGSRARAYYATGSPTGSDPLCIYQPPAAAPRALPLA